MSKQELFNKTLEAKRSMQLALDHIQATKHNDGEYERGMRNAFADCVRWIDELYSETDEPKKVVVPLPCKVVDVIEKLESEDAGIAEIYERFDEMDFYENEDVYTWFMQAGNPDILMKALVNGYEVEKEQLYRIPLPNLITSYGEQQFLSFDENNSNYFASRKRNHLKQTFTLSEIEDMPEEYKKFAVKVEEEHERD